MTDHRDDENRRDRLTRRDLLGAMGKLAYIAPALTLLGTPSDNAHAFSVPCPPNEPNCNQPGRYPPGPPRRDRGNG